MESVSLSSSTTTSTSSSSSSGLVEKAIPLILPENIEWDSKTNKYEKRDGQECSKVKVCPEALSILQSIQEPICVIVIAGMARTGKSYIINRVLGKHDAFTLGSEVDAQTLGIWMWNTPFYKEWEGKRVAMVLLDTEGLAAPNAPPEHDARIFTLSVLLASYLIFNTSSNINNDAIDKLSFVASLSQNIAIKSEDVGKEEQQEEAMKRLKDFFPSFLWLVRDFSLSLGTHKNDPTAWMTDCILLNEEKVKRIVKKHAEARERRNEVRQTILLCFPKLECFTLPSPVIGVENFNAEEDDSSLTYEDVFERYQKAVSEGKRDEFFDALPVNKRLWLIGHIDEKYLNKQFVSLSNTLVDKIKSEVSPKKGHAPKTTLSGRDLALILPKYVDSLNHPGSVPVLSDIWTSVLEENTKKATEKGLQHYTQKMEEILPPEKVEPIEESKLEGVHEKGFTEALTIFDNESMGFGEEKINFLESFKKEISKEEKQHRKKYKVSPEGVLQSEQEVECPVCVGGEYSKYLARNYALSKAHSKKLLNDIMTKLKPFSSLDDYQKAIEESQREYFGNARGPAKYDVVVKKLSDFDKTIKPLFLNLSPSDQSRVESGVKAARQDAEGKAADDFEKRQWEQFEKTQKAFYDTTILRLEKEMETLRQESKTRAREEEERIEKLRKAKFTEESEMWKDVMQTMNETFHTTINALMKQQEGYHKKVEKLERSVSRSSLRFEEKKRSPSFQHKINFDSELGREFDGFTNPKSEVNKYTQHSPNQSTQLILPQYPDKTRSDREPINPPNPIITTPTPTQPPPELTTTTINSNTNTNTPNINPQTQKVPAKLPTPQKVKSDNDPKPTSLEPLKPQPQPQPSSHLNCTLL